MTEESQATPAPVVMMDTAWKLGFASDGLYVRLSAGDSHVVVSLSYLSSLSPPDAMKLLTEQANRLLEIAA